jgi:hypothetical protein
MVAQVGLPLDTPRVLCYFCNMNKRKEDMLDLRLNKRLTLKEIGNIYGISRERVRQIIGNSRIVTHWSIELKVATEKRAKQRAEEKQKRIDDIKKYITSPNKVVIEALGRSNGFIADWRNKLGVIYPKNTRRFGREGEALVSKILSNNGVTNKLMGQNHPFDILLGTEKRVEVKYAQKPHGVRKNTWSFCIKNNRKNYDFMILLTGNKDVFIIPKSELPTSNCMSLCWPYSKNVQGRSQRKYSKYIGRFDLLT